jgi:Mor family transcriptional regulator
MGNESKFIVVIGDVISSRKVEQRNELQKKLRDILDDLNTAACEHHLVSPYTITLGDEFQAVYDNANCLFLDSIRILERTFPQKIRFSFGIGEISTDINREQSLGMDGSAFYYAREGITHLKDLRGKFMFHIHGLGDPELEDLFNNFLLIFSNQLEGWNRNRYVILRSMMEGKAVKKIAKKLELTETAVYMNIYDGSIREMIAIQEIMINRINARVLEKG